MNSKQSFQLIDGSFTSSEASRVLFALVQSKIDYHRLEKLSNEERFGKDTAHSEKRLQELAKLQAAMKEYLSVAADANQTLEIKGIIEISVVNGVNFQPCAFVVQATSDYLDSTGP